MKLAVGFFDGVHTGHRRILRAADAALTFRNHPATVLAPDRAPPLLMTCADRLAAIAAELPAPVAGTVPNEPVTGTVPEGEKAAPESRVRALEFTAELASESPDAFLDWLRTAYPSCDTIVCGPNWRFGARGAGDADILRTRGYSVEVPDFADWKGSPVSSTRIRAALAAGELADVTALLGRPWAVTGKVRSGKGLGCKLGFPTLNLHLPDDLVSPPFGVYALATPFGRALANWGLAPTLGERAWTHPVLEVHLLAPTAEFLHSPAPIHSLRVDWLRFIRPERTFASCADLQAQIARDISTFGCFESV